MTTSEPSKKKFRSPGKTRKRQYGEGAIYQRADGMWVGTVSLPPGLDGKRRRTPPVYSKDRKKVLAKLDDVKDNLRNGIEPLPKQRYTVEQWMRKWLEEIKKPTLAPRSVRTYASCINNQIVPAIGQADLGKLTPDHVRFLIEYIVTATDEVKTADGGVGIVPRWSATKAQAAYDQLSSALEDALKHRPRLVKENVAKLVHRPKAGPREDQGSHTAEHARAVLTSALAVGDPLTSLWAARYITGLRQGELLGLRVSALDFEALTLDVSWQLQRVPLKPGVKRNSDDPNRFDVQLSYEVIPLTGAYALVRPKTKKPRLLPMPPELALILVAYLKDQEPNAFGLVWVREGMPIRAEDEGVAWYAAQERAGVPIIRGHGTRHTANSLIPVDETQRMKFLGQSSAVVNRRYLHEDIAQLRAGQGALAGMVLPERIIPTGRLEID